jgi:ribonuclease P protein component
VRLSRDYARSRADGRRFSSRAFGLEITRTHGPVRLGLVVSRKVGGAVVRNRVKRRVREWFRRHRGALPQGADLVVIARASAATLSAAAVRDELSALVARSAR